MNEEDLVVVPFNDFQEVTYILALSRENAISHAIDMKKQPQWGYLDAEHPLPSITVKEARELKLLLIDNGVKYYLSNHISPQLGYIL